MKYLWILAIAAVAISVMVGRKTESLKPSAGLEFGPETIPDVVVERLEGDTSGHIEYKRLIGYDGKFYELPDAASAKIPDELRMK